MLYITLAAAALFVGLDQLTKWLAVTFIKPEGSIPLLKIGGKEWLNLTYQENTGAAFSIMQNKQLFLIILTSIVILVMLFLVISKRVKRTPYLWSFALIIAGGIGNLIDRIFLGYVVDFVDVRIINFAVFNFADVCAVCGAIMLFVFFAIDEFKDGKKKKADKATAEKLKEAATEAETDNADE